MQRHRGSLAEDIPHRATDQATVDGLSDSLVDEVPLQCAWLDQVKNQPQRPVNLKP
jgi:hypothetical protein